VTVKVLGIYGSPRKGGNTDLLLDRVLEGARTAGGEVRSLYARDLKIGGCLECGGCDDTGECVVPDDMDKVYPLLEEARIIFLAAPVFFYNVPAQLKALIDRTQALWSKRRLETPPEKLRVLQGGKGYLIAVGATKGANLFQGCELTARYFYEALGMTYEGSLFFKKVEAKGEILNHRDAMSQALAFGKNAVESMKT
jgi:multimeric flavodoxin WrbA